MNRFLRYHVDHILFWATTVSFHMYTRFPLLERAGLSHYTGEVVIRNFLLAGLIYLNLGVLIPRFAQRNRVWTFTVLVLFSLLVYTAAKNLHDLYLYGQVLGDELNFLSNSFYNIAIGIFYLTFSVALHLSRQWFLQRERLRKIELEKLNTELEYLKSQINPHFLFNSINTIYFQIDKNNKPARETLSAFSDMLRYQLYECNGNDIPIEKEVAYLKNYVELQRLRKDENYAIDFVAEGMTGFAIAPLLLIPFVENAFKHVSHWATGNKVGIALTKNDGWFHLQVRNTKETPAGNHTARIGIGLRNVQRRLDLLYDGRHKLLLNDSDKLFHVHLQLLITP